MAARLDARLPPTREPVEVVKELAEMMFKSEGFKGNEEDYYAASNSLLDHVLRARTGIPISLSVVFAAVCRRVGVVLDAIGLPGHFLLGIKGRPASSLTSSTTEPSSTSRNARRSPAATASRGRTRW